MPIVFSSRVRRTAIIVALVLVSGWSELAHAQRVWDTDLGAYLSYDFGGRRPGHFGFGIEVREMYSYHRFNCGTHAYWYGGVATRLAMLGWDQFRVLVAPQFGLTGSLPYPYPPATASAGGELGLGYRFMRDPGRFLQPGIEVNFANVPFLRVDHSFGRESGTQSFIHSGSMDLGARLAPTGTHGLSGSSCD
ncbi:MAG TPA: hypothetical protein VH374_25110 [Polyangia bacterium]|nr:hypothetical protein [Polyangia bacterium]